TGGADADKSGKGKKVIIGAVIGILVIIASWTIVNTLITLQGTTGGGGGGAGGIVQANAVQVTISGTTLIGANVQGTVTVYQGQTATAQLSGSTAKGFISTPATIDVTLQGATVIIGDNVTLPAANTFQQEIDATGPLRKGKVNINILQ
ncbi:MAG TPA: hypothetical protein VJB68_09385, partial [Methylophilaceae bacterium]|nr:hypothetical protein [Methylophilaceae bacterium]